MLSLFDTYISSVLCYGCEVWGFHKSPEIERVHIEYCKRILNVKTRTSNVMTYYELGRYPKCNLYQYLVPTFYIQTYLTKPMPELYKKYIIKRIKFIFY